MKETGSAQVLNCEKAGNPQRLEELLHSAKILVTFSRFDTPESNFYKGQ